MTKLLTRLGPAAGAAGGGKLFVEDVFSTFLYTGTGSSPTITTGIDMLGEGGLVWNKNRTDGYANLLVDSERGVGKYLSSDSTAAQANITGNSFTNTGYVLGTDMGVLNSRPSTYASWSFRKAAGWFDIQTYSGNGTQGRTVAHNLGSVPKMIIIKTTSESRVWFVWHESFNLDDYIDLNTTNQKTWGGVHPYLRAAPTSTTITLDSDPAVNGSGRDYVVYLFGDDAIFGEDGDEQICKMGTYTTDSGGESSDIDLGFEPQWVIAKQTNASGNGWFIMDSMRGFTASSGGTKTLQANSSAAEGTHSFVIRNNGFKDAGAIAVNATVLYMAIRRPMKVPTAGTEVYSPTAFTGTGAAVNISSGFPVDLAIPAKRTGTVYFNFRDRLRGSKETFQLPLTNAEYSNASVECQFDRQDGIRSDGTNLDTGYNANNQTSIIWQFKRASQFMDVVAYTGTSSIRQQAHNLGVAPEFVIVKGRNFASHWYTYHSGQTGGSDALHSTMRINSTEASFDTQIWKNYDFNASTFSLDADNSVNGSSYTYIAYLFATLAGISKVGSYTGNATNTTIDCGFSNGARFILIKRTDASGNWYVYNSASGITTGISPYLVWNSTAAEVTNAGWLEAASSGFLVNDNGFTQINLNNATYIFLAIA